MGALTTIVCSLFSLIFMNVFDSCLWSEDWLQMFVALICFLTAPDVETSEHLLVCCSVVERESGLKNYYWALTI